MVTEEEEGGQGAPADRPLEYVRANAQSGYSDVVMMEW